MTGNGPLPFPHDPAAPSGASRSQVESEPGKWNWREAFEQDIGNLFFLALLITGDFATAESALLVSQDLLDARSPTGLEAVPDEVKRAVVRSSVRLARQTQQPRVETPSSLPVELELLLRLDPDPRCCFVLRILAGYSNRDCALLLDLVDKDVVTLLRTALMSLSAARSPASETQAPAADQAVTTIPAIRSSTGPVSCRQAGPFATRNFRTV